MKFANFCCLLVFCPFEILHASKVTEDVRLTFDDIINNKYSSKLNDFLEKKGGKTVALLEAAKKAHKNTVGCDQGFYESNEEIYWTFTNECSDCITNVRGKNSNQVKVDCCNQKFETAKSKADVMVKEAKECLDGL